MSSLFDKISTLVNAQVHEVLGRNPQSPLARIRLNADDAEKDPRRSVQSLRRRLDEAVDFEDVLQVKVDGLMREALELDRHVDGIMRSGDDIEARRLQAQLNTKQQQLTIAESELRDHRLLTRHLMQEMTTLESALERQEKQGAPGASNAAESRGRMRIPIDGTSSSKAPDSSLLNSFSAKLDETRENLENLLNKPKSPEPPSRPRPYQKFDVVDEEPDPRQPKSRKSDPEDMNRRLSRLRKPSDDVG